MDPALSTAQTVQVHLEAPFESMENLLMTISPMFRERFQQALYDKLQSVQAQQQQMGNPLSLQQPNSNATLHPQQLFTSSSSIIHPSTSASTNNTTNNNNNDIQFDELNNWIN